MAFAPEVKKRIERALAGTKRRVLVDEPEARFLVYRTGGSGDSAPSGDAGSSSVDGDIDDLARRYCRFCCRSFWPRCWKVPVVLGLKLDPERLAS